MNTPDLEAMLLKKILGVAYEEMSGEARLVIVTTQGRTFYFTSDSPIDLEVETEQ